MENWKKEMINTIMDGGNIHETLAILITQNYEKDDMYLDNLAGEVAKQDLAATEELKEYLDDEVMNHTKI